MKRTTLVTAILLGALPAQELQPRHFYLDDYSDVMRFDLKRMRDLGVWDDVRTSTALMLGMIEQQAGFSLDRLDRVTVFFQSTGEGDALGQRELFVLEGNAELTLRPSQFDGEWDEQRIGRFDVEVSGWNPDDMRVLVRPELRVSGHADLIRPVLEGKPRQGLPSADVMSFLAGKKNLLGYLVVDMRRPSVLNRDLVALFGDAAWPDDDRPTHLCFRLQAVGDEDDPHVVLELVVRHGKQGEGLGVTEKAVDARLAELIAMKEARLFRPVLKKIEHERQGTDAIYKVDLGRSRTVAGLLAGLMPFMVFASAQSAQLEAVEEVVEPPPPPPPEEPKPRQGGGGQ